MHPDPRELREDSNRLRRAVIAALSFAVVLWLIKTAALLFGWDMVRFGVYPQTITGLRGILVAPLIHASVAHLFANTAPVIVLGSVLLYGYPRSAPIVLPVIYLGSGAGVWLFARQAHHVGASGLTFGLMFFIFTIGILRRDKRSIGLALVVFFLYGSMIWGIFPQHPGVSYESHFFGAFAGVLLAVLLRHRDPPPPQKTYSWETDAGQDAEEAGQDGRPL